MKKIVFLLFAGFRILGLAAQTDTTEVRKNDVYDIFKKPENTYPASGTISIDSGSLKAFGKTNTQIASFDYFEITNRADSFFNKKQFSGALNLYLYAFKNNNDRGQVKHRYNTACCYAFLQQPDNAFTQLYRIAEKGNYYNYKEIEADAFFSALKKDKRWEPLLKIIRANAKKIEDELNSKTPLD